MVRGAKAKKVIVKRMVKDAQKPRSAFLQRTRASLHTVFGAGFSLI